MFQLFATPRATACQASLSITNSLSLLKLMSIESMMSHLILCCPLPLLPSVFPNIREFSNESVLHIRWPEYWGFSFSMSPFNEYSGLISFRIDWFDLLAVQGTLKSLVQHHSSKAPILWRSVFFMVQLWPSWDGQASQVVGPPVGFLLDHCPSTAGKDLLCMIHGDWWAINFPASPSNPLHWSFCTAAFFCPQGSRPSYESVG